MERNKFLVSMLEDIVNDYLSHSDSIFDLSEEDVEYVNKLKELIRIIKEEIDEWKE